MEDRSDTSEGAPSADTCEKAEGDGRGASTIGIRPKVATG